VKRVKSFVNIHLHCIVNLKRMNKLRRCSPGKIYADAHGCTDFDAIRGGAVWFNSFKSLRNDIAKVVSFLNLHTKPKISNTQGRNEVRWRPGQEASLAPPCSNLRTFGSKCTVLKKVLVTLFVLYGASQTFGVPIVTRHQ